MEDFTVVLFNLITGNREIYPHISFVRFVPSEGDYGAYEFRDRFNNLLHCFSAQYFVFVEIRPVSIIDDNHSAELGRLVNYFPFTDLENVESSGEAGAQPVEERDPGAPEVASESTAFFY